MKLIYSLALLLLLSTIARAQMNSASLLVHEFDDVLTHQMQAQTAAEPFKWYTITNADKKVMVLAVVAGYIQGWRDEWLYHRSTLLGRFGLENDPFWNDTKPKGFLNMQWDADHLFKSMVVELLTVGIIIKGEDLRRASWKGRFWPLLLCRTKEGTLYYGSYKFGHMAAYNLTHGNKL